MPIYEFYCPDCHTVFSFLSQKVGNRKQPDCPRCRRPRLGRRPSTFAISTGAPEHEEGDPFAGLDEHRLEGAMAAMAGEVDRLGDSEDPRVMSRLFRRFGDLAGLELGPKMEDALGRLDAGEDLDALEEDLGGDGSDGGDDDLSDLFRFKASVLRRSRRPAIDDTLHFL